MKIMGRTQPLDRYPILDCLEVIARLGFDGVEICLENDDMAPDVLTPELIEQVRERVEALGLAPHSISYHKDYIYDDHLFELTQRAIRLTPAFGTEVFVFSGTRARSGDKEEWDRMVERTRALVELAEEHEVVLAQEFEPGFIVGSTADLMSLFAELPSPAMAANLDLGHVFLCDPDPLEAVFLVGEKIVHTHVENMARDKHDHLLPEEGDMELAAYLKALREVGYDGGLSLDLYKYDYEAVAPGAIAYLRSLLEEIGEE